MGNSEGNDCFFKRKFYNFLKKAKDSGWGAI